MNEPDRDIGNDDSIGNDVAAPNPEPRQPLSEAAKRALAEAEARRASPGVAANLPREINGRGGLDPARFGDWEVKGLAIDF
jgi:hypothetical protein